MTKITIEVPLPREIHTALKEVADADDRSMASAVRIAIKRYIESQKGIVVNSVKAKEVAKPVDELTPERISAVVADWLAD